MCLKLLSLENTDKPYLLELFRSFRVTVFVFASRTNQRRTMKVTLVIVSIFLKSLGTRDENSRKFANSVGLGEVAHNEPPHLDLHCLLSGL